MTAIAVVTAALTSGLAFMTIRSPGAPAERWPATKLLVCSALLAGGPLIAALSLRSLLLWSAASTATWVVVRLIAQRRALDRAGRRATQVLLACESLAGDLGAGLAQRPALERVARQWPEFAPVAAAAHLDADVTAELRRLADLPGAAELAVLAAAWQVAGRSGASLASTLDGIGVAVRGDAATHRLVETELAAARATAHLLIALPVAVLLLGQGIGARPWRFLLGSAPGLSCLAVAVGLDLAGLWWLQRIAARVSQS